MRGRDWLSLIALAAACATAIFVVGSAFRWTQGIVAVLTALALAPQLMSRRAFGAISPLAAALGVATALTVIALLPLPTALRDALDPTGTALREDGASLLDIAPWPALTRDVAGSMRVLAFFVTLLGAAVVALRLAASERGRHRLITVVGGLCVLTALVGGVHELLGASRLYGIYTVEHANPTVLAPLLNENHFGSLMALGTCIAIGLTMHPRQPSWMRVSWLVAVLICGGAAAASGSRGALLALVVGGCCTGVVLLAQRFAPTKSRSSQRRRGTLTNSLPITIVGMCVVVLVIYAGAGKVSNELSQTSMHEVEQPRSKFEAWRSARSLVEETPWVGVSPGGFESSFTRVHRSSSALTFSHLENEYLQAVVDWGIPGALLLGAAIIWFWTVALRRWRDSALAAGALGALAAVAVQSTVDFGVELLGLALPVTIVAATLSYVPLNEVARSPIRGRALRAVQLFSLAGAALLLFSDATKTLKEDHDSLSASLPIRLDAIREVATRHPLDYYSYALAAEEVSRTGDPLSIRLLNHAMLLHPTHPDLHRMAARLLYRAGFQDQAIIEYATAIRNSVDATRLVTEIASRFKTEDAARAIPADIPDMSKVLAALEDLKRADIAALWLARVVETRPRDVGLCNLVYEFSMNHGDLHSAEVVGRHCVELLPDHQTRMSLAKLLAMKGSYAETVTLLMDVESWRGRNEEKLSAWFMLCNAQLALKQFDEAKSCLRLIDSSGLLPLERRVEIEEQVTKIEEERRQADLQRSAGSAQR